METRTQTELSLLLERELMLQPAMKLELVLVPATVLVLESAHATAVPTQQPSTSLARRSHEPQCPHDAQKMRHRPPQRPTSHTTCEFPTAGPLQQVQPSHVSIMTPTC